MAYLIVMQGITFSCTRIGVAWNGNRQSGDYSDRTACSICDARCMSDISVL